MPAEPLSLLAESPGGSAFSSESLLPWTDHLRQCSNRVCGARAREALLTSKRAGEWNALLCVQRYLSDYSREITAFYIWLWTVVNASVIIRPSETFSKCLLNEWRSEWASKTESYENARKQVTDLFIIRKGTYFLQESHIKQSDIVMLNNKEWIQKH